MKNISLGNNPISLIPNAKYLVIDALYVEDIKQAYLNLKINGTMFIDDIREKVFPFTDTPFAEYIPQKSTFALKQLEKINYNQVEPSDRDVLSTDTGLLLFLKEEILKEFSLKFNYGELVNSSSDLINEEYWNLITSDYNPLDVAIILSAGTDSGLDFDGSGTYRLKDF